MNELTELFESLADEFDSLEGFTSPYSELAKMALEGFEARLGQPLPFSFEDMEKRYEQDNGAYYVSPKLNEDNGGILNYLYPNTHLALEIQRGKEVYFKFILLNAISNVEIGKLKINAKGALTKSGFRL